MADQILTEETANLKLDALKPCPFCGCHGLSAAYPRIVREELSAVIECHTDNCGGMLCAHTLPKAITAWNTRAQPGKVTGEA